MNILIAGDFCPRGRVARLIEEGNFNSIFSGVRKITSQADYSIVNLECPIVKHIAEPIEKRGLNLKCTEKSLEVLLSGGFDCVTLANNHFYDYGEVGVSDTLDALNFAKMDFVGGGNNIEAAAKVLYKKIDDKILAIINCCEHEYSIATEKKGGANPLNSISLYYAILEAKNKADYVIVIIHGGHEHYQLPSPRMKETYHYFIDVGADAVINHHQHCYSGYEFYNNKPIFYGIGNFCFELEGQNDILWNNGYIVLLSLDLKISVDIIPYSQCNINPTIDLYTGEQKNDIMRKIENLNSIIADDFKLQEEFNVFSHSLFSDMKLSLSPYSSRLLKSLCWRRLIPSFVTKKRLLNVHNYVECESYKDVFITYLKNELHKF